MTNANSDGKRDFKMKVGHLMQEYQRSKQEEARQKLQLKQNIMMQIMNNRNKPTQTLDQIELKSRTSQTYNSEPHSQQYPPTDPLPQVTFNPKENNLQLGQSGTSTTRNLLQANILDAPEPLRTEEITFNAQKRNRSLQEEISYRPEAETQEARFEQMERDEDEYKKSINRIAKYANKYFPNQFQDKIEISKPDIRSYQKQAQEGIIQDNFSKENTSSLADISAPFTRSQLPKTEELKQYTQPEQPEEQEDSDNHESEQDQRGVFLTMEESESMTGSDVPKNVAFQIKMDKSVDPDHLQELRKQKIRQMQKKRQERIEEYRRNEANKKVQMPRGRSSHALKHQKTEKQEIEVEIPPRSVAIERKSNLPKPNRIQNRSERQPTNPNLIPLEQHESQYQMKHSRANKKYDNEVRGSNTYLQPEEPNYPPPISPMRTPKTILSEHRPKSMYKNSNIFAGQSQYHRQKSANRIPEPKIQPKDRKYSFTRQSNKKLMVNAITYVCFPGELNRKDRQRLIDVLQSSEHEFFVFLFKEYSRKIIKAIYILDNSQTRLEKIYGDKGPLQITADRVKEFYRFDSGSREFKKVDGCRSFSFIIHAIDLS